MTAPLSPPPDLRARVLAATRREPAPTRAQTKLRTAIAIAVGYLMSLAVFVILGGADIVQRPATLVLATAAGWMVIALAATWGALGRGASMLGPPREMLLLIAIVTAPLLFAWAIVASRALLPTPAPEIPQFVACFLITNLLSVGPFGALAFARRRSDPVHPRITGAAIGAAAGAWAAILIDLHCPSLSMRHIGLGHVAPTLAASIMGAWIGKRVFGLRPV